CVVWGYRGLRGNSALKWGDRQDARPHRAGQAARYRRRGPRVITTRARRLSRCISPNLARGCRSGMSKSNQWALALCVAIMGLSAFGACLRARIGSFLPALVAFAATPCDDIG